MKKIDVIIVCQRNRTD